VNAALLPPGTYVVVDEPARGNQPAEKYIARVVGYDLFGTKYELSRRYAGGLFLDGGSWAFPGQVREISEEGARS
jgi:hypothetical protein